MIPPPALKTCDNATVYPIAKKCYNYSRNSSYFFDCLKFELFNTPGCYHISLNYMEKHIKGFKAPPAKLKSCVDQYVTPVADACVNFTGKTADFFECFRYELFNTPGCYAHTLQKWNRTVPGFVIPPPELPNCSNITVKPKAMQCYKLTGNSTFFFDCLKFELFNTPGCYSESIDYMKEHIPGFIAPPPAL